MDNYLRIVALSLCFQIYLKFCLQYINYPLLMSFIILAFNLLLYDCFMIKFNLISLVYAENLMLNENFAHLSAECHLYVYLVCALSISLYFRKYKKKKKVHFYSWNTVSLFILWYFKLDSLLMSSTLITNRNHKISFLAHLQKDECLCVMILNIYK